MTFENIGVYNMLNAVRGMRNPMNGAALSDSHESFSLPGQTVIGPKDYDLARRLILAGEPHRKFLRQIFVSVDITAPGYWWTEMDTYKIATTRDSSSTMHRITSRALTIDDFESAETASEKIDLENDVVTLNYYRSRYLMLKDEQQDDEAEKYFRAMKRRLPAGYLFHSTWTGNYETLANIYYWRHNHRLPIWHVFCEEFIERLPYSEFITRKFPKTTSSAEPRAAR